MSTDLTFLASQRRQLFSLLRIKKANPEIKINALDEIILETIATMRRDDVTYVEEQITKL